MHSNDNTLCPTFITTLQRPPTKGKAQIKIHEKESYMLKVLFLFNNFGICSVYTHEVTDYFHFADHMGNVESQDTFLF